MRILRPIVAPSAGNVFVCPAEITQCGPVGWQFIGYHFIGCISLLLQQFAHQFERCLLVAPGLNKDIQHLALAVHCPPKIHPSSVYGDKNFVQMPAAIRPGSKAPQLSGIGPSELQRPAPYRLIGDINAALGEQVLDVAKANTKRPEI